MIGSFTKAARYLGIAVCMNLSCNPTSQQGTQVAETNATGEWIELIGETPGEHWHSYLKDTVTGWQVNEGILSTSGKNGDLVTNDTFGNFELEVEWKINQGGNSGIFYYVVEEPKYKRMYETGPEFQIIDDEGYPQQLTDAQKVGSLSDVMAPSIAAANPPGSWNHTRIVVNDNHAAHWLNGKQILSYELGTPQWDEMVAASKFAELDYGKTRTGRIGLQDHGGEVFFRNIRVRPL